jgi:dTDP-4-dehydrorhamnose reductase
VLQWAQEHETLRIVDDQISTPTWSRTLAEATAQIIAQGKADPIEYLREKRGLYHLADSGYCSRYEWAKVIIENAPNKERLKVKEIFKAKSEDFPTPASRPARSAMSCKKFEEVFDLWTPVWEESLRYSLIIDKSEKE